MNYPNIPTFPVLKCGVHCPKNKIIIVYSRDPYITGGRDPYITGDRWIFGPGTVNPWPDGDYHNDFDELDNVVPGLCQYEERAFQTYHEFADDTGHEYKNYGILDPDYLMDVGL